MMKHQPFIRSSLLALCVMTSAVPAWGQAPETPCGSRSTCFILAEDAFSNWENQRAVRYMEYACALDSTGACNQLGRWYERGEAELIKDPKKSQQFYRMACEGGNSDACASLGVQRPRNLGPSKHSTFTNALYQKACDNGLMESCARLGFRHEKGQGMPKNQKKANQLFRKSCDGGNTIICDHIASNHQNGVGTPKNFALASLLYRKACDDEWVLVKSCGRRGLLHEKGGHGLTRDQNKANKIFNNACTKGDFWSCIHLGVNFEKGLRTVQNQKEARTLYRVACQGGNGRGCWHLGASYQRGANPDLMKAVQLYQKACRLKEVKGCSALAEVLCQRGERAESDKMYAKALALGSRAGKQTCAPPKAP